MSPTKRVKRVSSIRTPRVMVSSFFPLSHLRERVLNSKSPLPADFVGDPLPQAGEGKARAQQASHLLIGIHDRLPVGAGLLEPVGGELLADLLEAGGKGIARRQHLHALGLELVEVPIAFGLPQL